MGRSSSVVLLGLVLVVAGLIAQESQPQVNGTPQRHINSIELTRVSGKPISCKGSAEMVQNPENGKLVRLRTEAMWARDSKGRIYYDTRSPVPAESDQTPQIVGTVVIDPSAGTFTACWPSLQRCYVSKLNPAGEASCSALPVPDDVAITWANLGEENVGGIVVAHTREICTHRGSSSSTDFWRNSPLGIGLNVYTAVSKKDPLVIDWKVSEVSQAEPDAKLFALPIGYVVLDGK